MRRVVAALRRRFRPADPGYGTTVASEEHLRLEQAFSECAGQWVAVHRGTGEVLAAAHTPYELAAQVRTGRIRGVDIVRAPSVGEPEVVGFG